MALFIIFIKKNYFIHEFVFKYHSLSLCNRLTA